MNSISGYLSKHGFLPPAAPLLFLITILLFGSTRPLQAEVRLSVDTEFYNTFSTLNGPDDWRYFLTGLGGAALHNKGSGNIRGELSLEFSEIGGTAAPETTSFVEPASGPGVKLKRLYIRPAFGDILVSLGKTRSTWGAGYAFNAGDIIFGSDTVNFDTRSEDPRSETAWLTNAEIPFGAFDFFEFILLPGNFSAGDEEADPSVPSSPPPIEKTSGGARISIERGIFNFQTGYLFRGDRIAGLGETGHRAYISIEGIEPVSWHISSSATADADFSSPKKIEKSWMVTGGAAHDHTVLYDRTFSWTFEFLAKPYGTFVEESTETADGYGLYLYPSVSFAPRNGLSYTLSSILSPIDISAHTTLGMDWNIYEELTLLAYASLQLGEEGADIFHLKKAGGISCSMGARYRY
ncbi:MAG: hypothetical protein ACLFSA_06565 [Spirochaetaceae bacterium]